MKSSETKETIQAKYNRLCARFRDLQQQAAERQEKWSELEQEFKNNEALARELCELILAKDPSEMRLGAEYSWNSLNMREMIQRSKSTFTSYNETRTELLRDIQRQSEERRLMIESLQTQIEQESHTIEQLKAIREHDPEDDAPPQIDAQTGEVLDPPPAIKDSTMNRVAYSTQQAVKRGDIEILGYQDENAVESSSAPDGKPAITTDDIRRGQNKKPVATKMKVWEEPKDNSAADMEQRAEMAEKAVFASLAKSGSAMSTSAKKANAAAAHKMATAKQFVSIDVTEIEQKLTNRHWAVLDAIGSTGMCEGGDIIDAAIEAIGKTDGEDVTNSGLRYILMNLVNCGCLIMDSSVTHPLKSRFATYALSPIGRSLYTSHFGKNAVVSERDILIAEHDNLEHAFGIKELKRILEQSGNYTNVSMARSNNTFKLKDGTSYIPDIVAQCKSRGKTFRAYMEYERGTHHQSDFNIKLNKAIKITRYVDIVCPNNEIAANLKDKTAVWIEAHGGAKNLSRIKVRITTLRRLNGVTNINHDDNWLYTFNLSNGETPIERK